MVRTYACTATLENRSSAFTVNHTLPPSFRPLSLLLLPHITSSNSCQWRERTPMQPFISACIHWSLFLLLRSCHLANTFTRASQVQDMCVGGTETGMCKCLWICHRSPRLSPGHHVTHRHTLTHCNPPLQRLSTHSPCSLHSPLTPSPYLSHFLHCLESLYRKE